MLTAFENLVKGVVSAVVVAPAALIADICTLPASSMDPYRGPFTRTARALKNAGECFDEAVKPVKENT